MLSTILCVWTCWLWLTAKEFVADFIEEWSKSRKAGSWSMVSRQFCCLHFHFHLHHNHNNKVTLIMLCFKVLIFCLSIHALMHSLLLIWSSSRREKSRKVDEGSSKRRSALMNIVLMWNGCANTFIVTMGLRFNGSIKSCSSSERLWVASPTMVVWMVARFLLKLKQWVGWESSY